MKKSWNTSFIIKEKWKAANDLFTKIAARYFPCRLDFLTLHTENHQKPEEVPVIMMATKQERIDIEEEKLVNMNYLSD